MCVMNVALGMMTSEYFALFQLNAGHIRHIYDLSFGGVIPTWI